MCVLPNGSSSSSFFFFVLYNFQQFPLMGRNFSLSDFIFFLLSHSLFCKCIHCFGLAEGLFILWAISRLAGLAFITIIIIIVVVGKGLTQNGIKIK